jgi:hypothetical protein
MLNFAVPVLKEIAKNKHLFLGGYVAGLYLFRWKYTKLEVIIILWTVEEGVK